MSESIDQPLSEGPAECPTQYCSGDVRYPAPGRGHLATCQYPHGNPEVITEHSYPGLAENLKTGAKQDADRLTGYAVRLDKFVGRVRAKAVNDPKWTAAVVLATVYIVHNFKGPIKKALRGKRKFVTDVDFDDPYLIVKFNNKSEDKWDIMD